MGARNVEMMHRVAKVIAIGLQARAGGYPYLKLRQRCNPSERGCIRSSMVLSLTGDE